MTSCSCVRKNACQSGIEQFIVFRCPQLISICCGIVQYVVSDRPTIRLYSVYKNNQLRLPSLYAMIILLLFYEAHFVSAIIILYPFFAGVSSFVFQIRDLHASVSCYFNSIHFGDVVLLHYSLLFSIDRLAHSATSPVSFFNFFFQYACHSSEHQDSASGASNFAK